MQTNIEVYCYSFWNISVLLHTHKSKFLSIININECSGTIIVILSRPSTGINALIKCYSITQISGWFFYWSWAGLYGSATRSGLSPAALLLLSAHPWANMWWVALMHSYHIKYCVVNMVFVCMGLCVSYLILYGCYFAIQFYNMIFVLISRSCAPASLPVLWRHIWPETWPAQQSLSVTKQSEWEVWGYKNQPCVI